MDKASLLALYDRELRVEIEYPDQRKEAAYHITRLERSDGGMNSIPFSRLERYNAGALIAEQVAYFRKQGKSFTWETYAHDPFPELKQHLLANGFSADEPYPVMILDERAAPLELTAPAAVDVRRLVWPDQLDEVAEVEAQVWGRDFGWLKRRLEGWLSWPGYVSIYVAYMHDQPACAGWIVFHPDSHFASLFGGSTLEEYRGQGMYRAVLGARLQEARQRGRQYLILEPSAMNEPIVIRYGFEYLTTCQEFVWSHPDAA
jgi:hypothetical protein